MNSRIIVPKCAVVVFVSAAGVIDAQCGTRESWCELWRARAYLIGFERLEPKWVREAMKWEIAHNNRKMI